MLHDAYVVSKSAEASALSAVKPADDLKAILLATPRALVADRYGEPHAVRVLIDQGSEVSIVSESLVQRLHLRRSHSAVSIFGIGGSQSGATRGKVTLSLTSKVTGATLTAVAFILPRLLSYQVSTTRCRMIWPHIKGLPLADPEYLANDPVELLLGAKVCSLIFQDGRCKGGPEAPMAQKTTLGWILSGGCGVAALHGHRNSLQCTADHDLVELVRRFWEQKEVPHSPAALAPKKERCEDIFTCTHKRAADGRYIVRLPFSTTPTNLTETRKPAEKLLSAMERKYDTESQFGELYRSFMQEYENLQHMCQVRMPSTFDNQDKGATYRITEYSVNQVLPQNSA